MRRGVRRINSGSSRCGHCCRTNTPAPTSANRRFGRRYRPKAWYGNSVAAHYFVTVGKPGRHERPVPRRRPNQDRRLPLKRSAPSRTRTDTGRILSLFWSAFAESSCVGGVGNLLISALVTLANGSCCWLHCGRSADGRLTERFAQLRTGLGSITAAGAPQARHLNEIPPRLGVPQQKTARSDETGVKSSRNR